MLHNTLKALGRDTLLYGIAGGLQRLAPFFIVPILTRNLSQEAYGVYDTAIAAAMMMGGFAVLGQDNAVARFLYDDRSMVARSVVATSGFIIQFFAAIIFSAFILFAGDWVGSILFFDRPDLVRAWKLALWIVPGFSFFLFAQNLLKWTLMTKWFLALSGMFAFVNIFLVALLVVVFPLGIAGATIAQIASYGGLALVGIFSVRKYFCLKQLKDMVQTMKDMFLYGAPFVLSMVICNALPVIDRFFIVRFDTMENLGIYGLGLKVAMLMSLIDSTFQIAFGPIAFSMWDEKHASTTFRSLARIVTAVLGFFALLIAANGQVLVHVLGGSGYDDAVLLLPFLCASLVLSGMRSFTTLGIYKAKRSRYNLLVNLIGLAAVLVSNAILVPLLGVLGAAMSAVVVQAAMNICAHLISKHYYDSLIGLRDVWRTFTLLASGMAVIYASFLYIHTMAGRALALIMPLLFLIAEWFWVMHADERQAIINFVSCQLKAGRVKA